MQKAQEMWVQPLGQEDALEKEMATHPSILSGKSHGQRSLVGYNPWHLKESDMTELLSRSARARAHTHTHTHTHILTIARVQWLLYPGNCKNMLLWLPWQLSWWRICLQCRKPQFDPWVGKIPWRRAWQPTPAYLSGESPGTEEPGRLQSMGSQRAGHDWVTEHSTVIAVCLLSSPFLTNGFTVDSLSPLHHYAGETEGALWLVSGSRKSTYRNDAEILLCFKTSTWLEEIHELFFLRKG